MKTLLMHKDVPVLEVAEDGTCRILEPKLLPVGIRKPDVTLADYYGVWLSNRAIQLGRTNAKLILNSLRLPQTNSIAVCEACHALNLTDCYWIRNEEEALNWHDINLYCNTISKSLAVTALLGESLTEHEKIRTPELTTQGISAKAWIRKENDLYLYKIGRREVPASQILDALGIEHVNYYVVEGEELKEVASDDKQEQIELWNEKVVKSGLITSEERSLVTFEDYKYYCESQGRDPFDEILKLDRTHYLQMQVADYILNNMDRHTGNWGLFMDNRTGALMRLHPLMDHDHAFAKMNKIYSQTTGRHMTLQEAAVIAQSELHLDVSGLFDMEKPELLTQEEWDQVQARGAALQRLVPIYEEFLREGSDVNIEMLEKMDRWTKLLHRKIKVSEFQEHSAAETAESIGTGLC